MQWERVGGDRVGWMEWVAAQRWRERRIAQCVLPPGFGSLPVVGPAPELGLGLLA